MKSWRIAGREARAVAPIDCSSTGTSRQPSTCWPSAATVCSISVVSAACSVGSVGRKHIATP
jgi:hypothetical protein